MSQTQAPSVLLPTRIREAVRSRESGLALTALVIGAASGLCVVAIRQLVQILHVLVFRLEYEARLSASTTVDAWRALIGPAAGGICLTLIAIYVAPRLKSRLADAIEANALYGGRLSFRGSLLITAQTVLSSGFGASVGLEAGYTQICAAIASWAGQWLVARRADLRMLVAAGAAGAIGAAFNAPLAGAFYAFEVVLGTYTVASLVPVSISALMATLVATEVAGHDFLIDPHSVGAIEGDKFIHVVVIGVLCAGVSIALMKSVALVERSFKHWRLPAAFRPSVGGLLVGTMALLTPQILGSGHGAMRQDLTLRMPLMAIAALVLLKSLASAVSLGSGFRGGLFFASLLTGALTGRFYADSLALLGPGWSLDAGAAAIAGMAAFGTGVLGAPVTMTVLALETTSEISITVASLIASTVASLIVRETFGYSFATWRFHLRGELIRGPHDVGWVQDITVAKMMRSDVATAPSDQSVESARGSFPPGATKQIALVDPSGSYVGLVVTADLYASETDLSQPVARLASQPDTFLLPDMNIRRALEQFKRSQADALIVVASAAERQVIGFVSEAHVFRRYGEELERRNREFTS